MTDIQSQSQSSPLAAPSQNIGLGSTNEPRGVLQMKHAQNRPHAQNQILTPYVQSYPHAQSYPGAPQLQPTRDYLNDGYISYTFTPRNAEGYLAQLFNVGNVADIQAIRYQKSAFYVLNQPPHNSLPPPPHSVYGRNAWFLDYAVVSGGSVVPQQLWYPQGQGDRRRYVEQVQLRMPVFFVNANGNLGVPVTSAALGDIQLLGAFPSQLADKAVIKIRIGVCIRSFTTHPITYCMCRSQWPGYNPYEHQVQLRDQTPQKNPISFRQFARHVASRVKQFLLVRLSQTWR